jgi:D-arginine dehydrogenase
LLRDFLNVWTPNGSILTFDDAENANTYAARAARFGVVAELADKSIVAARWPALSQLRVTHALWVPGDGTIDVGALLGGLAQGIRVVLGCAVERVDQGTVVTSHGTIKARVVVDAAGAWAGKMTGGEPLASFKRHLFVLEAQSVAAGPWLWHLGSGEMYVRPHPDGVLASPCDSASCEPGHQVPDLVGDEHMRRLLDDADSPLAGAIIKRRWACQRAFTENRKMRLGRDRTRPWLVWAAGLGGHGATAALSVGEKVATAVVTALRGQ